MWGIDEEKLWTHLLKTDRMTHPPDGMQYLLTKYFDAAKIGRTKASNEVPSFCPLCKEEPGLLWMESKQRL